MNNITSKNLNINNKRGSELESLLHSEHTVLIEKLVVGGDGLARLNFQDKSLVVFVPLTAPDETVKIKIIFVAKNHLIGELIEIINPSESRRSAACEYYENCGGCNWQHITEAEQVKQKELILMDLFKKNIPNKSVALLPTVFSTENFHYRNRIQLKHLGSELGYFKKGSHSVVNIDRCIVAENIISDEIINLKNKLRPTTELQKYELRINHLNQFEHYNIGEDGEGLSFSQVNNSINEKLIFAVNQLVLDLKPSFITELYAGAGNFTLPLLKVLPELKMETVEMNVKLTRFSTKLLTDLKLQKRLFAFTSDCESFVKRRKLSTECVLLDPPRSGCSEAVLEQIIVAAPKNILYISCHPAFLLRDIKKILAAAPDYDIKHLQIFDMFPQTDHFETLVLLTK